MKYHQGQSHHKYSPLSGHTTAHSARKDTSSCIFFRSHDCTLEQIIKRPRCADKALAERNMQTSVICIHDVQVFAVGFPQVVISAIMKSRNMLVVELLHFGDIIQPVIQIGISVIPFDVRRLSTTLSISSALIISSPISLINLPIITSSMQGRLSAFSRISVLTFLRRSVRL